MKNFYKSFLFLFVLSALLIGLTGLLFPVRFLIPAFVISFVLSVFLLFFMTAYVKKNYLFSAVPPDDSCELYSIFQQLKKQYNLKDVQLIKLKEIDSACFYLSDLRGSLIVLSDNTLNSFNPEELACFLSYAFQKIKSGDALFLTVLSSFLFLVEKFFYILSYPFTVFKNKKTAVLDQELDSLVSTGDSHFYGKDGVNKLMDKDKRYKGLNKLGMGFVFRILSLMTRNIFYNNDRLLYKSDAFKEKKRNQALFLWKLDSFLSLNPPHLPYFFAPVFLTNFLTNLMEKDYIPLQPLIKNRVKNLVGTYPP